MGMLEIPRKMVHSYLRLVGLVLLIVYGMGWRIWASARPVLSPVITVYGTIECDDVTLATIFRTFLRALLLIGIWYWMMIMAVWQRVISPFRPQIDQFIHEVQNGHKLTQQWNVREE